MTRLLSRQPRSGVLLRWTSECLELITMRLRTGWLTDWLFSAWSLATGTLPQCSSDTHLPPKPAIMPDVEASVWIPYTDDGNDPSPVCEDGPAHTRIGAPFQRSCEQPSNVRSVYKCFCELSALVHDSLYKLHTPGRPLRGQDLLKIYTEFLDWYDSIPEVLRLGQNFTPAVLFAQ